MNNATDAGIVATGYNSGNRTKLVELSVMKGGDHQAHMDDFNEMKPCVYSGRDCKQANTSTFWQRRLDAAESADPDRLTLQTSQALRFTNVY